MKRIDVAMTAVRSLVPFQGPVRRLIRRARPYTDNPANSSYCIDNGLEQLAALRQSGFAVSGRAVLEFGSGWLPLIPMLLQAAGASRIVMTDVERLMDGHTIALARSRIDERGDMIAVALGIEAPIMAQRLDSFAPEYLVPWDAHTHPAADVDLVLSRATFEHVPGDALRDFIGQFHRILRPGGATCHVIDNSDHWQHKDQSLSRVAFLRYEEQDWLWRLAQMNTQSFQNRLRHGDYAALLSGAGLTIVLEQKTPDPGCLEDLKRITLASRFRAKTVEDLAVLSSLFVAVKPTG